MDNSFMVGLSTQQMLRQRMDVTANNLANMTTTGFKTESLVMRELSEKPAVARDKPQEINFVDAWRLQRDLRPGPLQRTGNPLDVAIEGEGFLAVQTPEGVAYTRDGRLRLDAQGQLVNPSGLPVLSNGQPIVVDPAAGELTVGENGAILQNGAVLGQLDVSTFSTPEAAEKYGDNLWKPVEGQTVQPAAAAKVRQGFLEGSNVNAVVEITQMIEISRSYQSVSKLIDQADEIRAASIEKLARVG